MPPEPWTNDRPSYYTMKTPAPVAGMSPQALTHSRSNSQSYVNSKPATSPVSSPRPPPSAVTPHPPKLSPAAAGGETSSPNYFGLAVDPTADLRESCVVPRENWSSPSSSVKSFAAVIPGVKQLPLDANPEFEAFRRQIDANRARNSFSLSASHFTVTSGSVHTPSPSTTSSQHRPRPPRWHTQGADGPDFLFQKHSRLSTESSSLGVVPGKTDRDADSLQGDSAYVSGDSKRSSSVSLNPPFSLHMPRQDASSPRPQSPFPVPGRGDVRSAMSRADGNPSPHFLARNMTASPTTSLSGQAGATVANQMQDTGSPTMMSPGELKGLLEMDPGGAKLLLLDLRVSPQFAQSRVRGALNLCIPTTLLKRSTFNLQKLQQTFQKDQDQEKFSNWRNADHLVVYDASSTDKRDAVSAINMIKKFTNEGYTGPASILRGGFNAFASAYPSLIDRSSAGSSPGLSLGGSSMSGGSRANLPPVIGGVLLPTTDVNPSPFFNNIRQNQDLVDGVGQMDIGLPSGLSEANLPRWLREAADTSDHGKRVSDRFLYIERTEQSRMREAYSVVLPADAPKLGGAGSTKVQLSGIEKGGKNRYKDILPFEHARVRLMGRPEGVCDYVNASHLQARRSYKRYIASQGPLPATYEDFWTVVWDHDVRVIVMLTAETEGGQLKCHPYWKGNDFGPIRLRVLSEKKVSLDIDKRRTPPAMGVTTAATDGSSSSAQSSPPHLSQSEGGRRRANTTTHLDSASTIPFNFNTQTSQVAETPYVIIRKFALSHTAHPFLPIREITQLHYPSWPDFGAPAQPSHLLALVELANVMQHAALPIEVSGTLGSASASRRNSDAAVAAADPAGKPFFAYHGSDRGGSSAGLKRADSESASLSWHDAPEPRDLARPMLVHCSAGCGRTGAFCTVDSVIDMLKRQRQHHMLTHSQNQKNSSGLAAAGLAQPATLERDADGDITMDVNAGTSGPSGASSTTPPPPPPPTTTTTRSIDTNWLDDDSIDLIAHTVEDFRGQRLSMVQSLRQFVLCYETVLEWIRRLQDDPRGARGRSGSLAF
ncbi:phosphatases II [Parathielavia appendiculata]|uniref:protein-tyrosine-phosphatase n=1 Tax=Parathielavia appendiculata TaxID=2587402 RepID=A0AAN6Z006_9PEZI|nr:phosphatases II [Parathielavia appendiculata]